MSDRAGDLASARGCQYSNECWSECVEAAQDSLARHARRAAAPLVSADQPVQTVIVSLADLVEVMEEASAHLDYWGAKLPAYDRINAIVTAARPITFPCACGCGRLFLRVTGWDGMHNTGTLA